MCSITRIYTHLHAFTRIYTHLHAITRFYTKFLGGNVGWEMEYGRGGVMGRCGKWSIGVVGCRPVCWPKVGEGGNKAGGKWEKVGCKRSVDAAFPTLARIIRRKWLISRI